MQKNKYLTINVPTLLEYMCEKTHTLNETFTCYKCFSTIKQNEKYYIYKTIITKRYFAICKECDKNGRERR